MEKIKITPKADRTLFHVEILLSDAQLRVLSEIGGDDEHETVDIYKEMAADEYGTVTLNPSFDSGLGADINDILSLGFLLYNHLREATDTKLSYNDLNFHPFRMIIPDIKSVDAPYVDCEIESEYVPMTMAIVKEDENEKEIQLLRFNGNSDRSEVFKYRDSNSILAGKAINKECSLQVDDDIEVYERIDNILITEGEYYVFVFSNS